MTSPLRNAFSLALLLSLVLTASPSALAEGSRVAWKTERVVVFKDGYCLVVKRGTAATDSRGEAFTEEVPDAAVLGSFWALAHDAQLRSMTAGWEEVEEESEREMDCQSTFEVLEANVGRQCSLMLGNETKLSGQILQVLGTRTTAGLSADQQQELGTRVLLSSGAPAVRSATATVSRMAGEQFVLRTEAGDVLLQAGQIRQLTIDDMRTSITRQVVSKSKRKRLKFAFREAEQDVELVMMYFRPGVRWIPTYRIDVAQPTPAAAAEEAGSRGGDRPPMWARLSLQGEILNEAEDLVETPIDLVVGVPNFRFRTLPSPLMAQELVTYTPAGGGCRIPVTVAVDLQGRVEDRETGRQLNDLQWYGRSYARVEGRIDVQLHNSKPQPVDVEVRLRFGGTADEISDQGRLRLLPFHADDWDNYRGEPAVNNSSRVTWQATVPPRESFTPHTTYHLYVRQ